MDTSDIAKQLGALGGKKTAKKYGKKHFSTIGKLANQKRWAGHVKKEKATKE